MKDFLLYQKVPKENPDNSQQKNQKKKVLYNYLR